MKFKNTTIRFSALIFSFIILVFVSCNKGPAPANIVVETLPVIDDGGDKVILQANIDGVTTSVNGFLFGTEPEPTLQNSLHIPGGAPVDGSIEGGAGVVPSTPAYYLRAYAFVNDEMHYGNEITFSTGHAIGESFGGGTVAYLFEPGDPGYDASTEHGLIIANEIFGEEIYWGCDSVYVSGATGTELGTGTTNTTSIVALCGEEVTAATLCDNYESDGFSDWYLPSNRELEKIDTNFDILGTIPGGHYWSSTQSVDTLKSWAIFLWTNESEGIPSGTYLKDYGRRAIAIRSF